MASWRAETENRRLGVSTWSSALVGPVFLSLAAWFLWGPDVVEIPRGMPSSIDRGLISTEPRRQILGDPPTIEVEGSRRTCADCHSLFMPSEDDLADPVLHGHIRLNHGINDRCRNCHDIRDRNRLVLHGGELVSYSESHLLCAKCHGPTYRDWERGSHGRTNGYWDSSRGELNRLKCSQCHDPHNPTVPAMDPIAPLPGPRALSPDSHGVGTGDEQPEPRERGERSHK